MFLKHLFFHGVEFCRLLAVSQDFLPFQCQETLDAVHHSCMFVQDEVVEELHKKGQKTEFDEEVVAQVAYSVFDTLCNTWPGELLQFAK